jgi:sugar phosphate isomerase/epimerase
MPTRRIFMEAASGAVLAALATGTAGAAAAVRGAAGAAGATSDPFAGVSDGAAAANGARGLTYCFFSKHLPDLNWTDLAAATIDMGFDGIDLTVRPKGHVAPERVAEDLPRALDAIRAKGTTVSMITTELTSASHPTAPAIFAAAGKAGIKLMKVGYWRYALKDVRAEVAAMGRDLAGLAALAKTHGVTIGIHNHQGNVGSALWEIAPYIDALDAQAIGYYFDPRHAFVEGGGVGWKAATLLAAPRMKMMSVKDAIWEKGPKGWAVQHCPMGEGMVDWPWFAAAIANSTFAGPVSVHLEYKIPGATPEELRRNTMSAGQRDLAFTKRQFAAVAERAAAGRDAGAREAAE